MTANTMLAGAAPAPSAPQTGVEASEQLAAALYPAPKPRPVDTPPNAEIAALREAEPARQVYKDADQFGPNGGAVRELALAVNPRGTAAELEGQQTRLAAVMTDIGMNRDDVSQLASFAEAYARKPPTAEEKAAHERAATKELRAQYGDGFDDAMADAMKLAKRDPRLHQFLGVTGLGSHPWVVSRMVELARSARARGQLS